MSNHFELYGICICTAILIFVLFSRRRHVFLPRQPIIHRAPSSIHRLLAPATTSNESLLRSRAAANARLERAFDLTNTFVSADVQVHSQFLSKSTALLAASQRDWMQFGQVALQAVELALPDRTTEFRTFVQSVTLSTAIVGLLAPDADITALDANDLQVVANLITRLWLLSKNPEQIPAHLRQELKECLRRLIPEEAYPNPLDFVIPAWETLWRLVAVTLAHVHADPTARAAFAELTESPESSQFAARLSETSPSALDYINESLRLDFLPRFLAARIPPRFVDVEIADIETAQRSAVWGPDPDAYDAGRFLCEPARAGEVLAFGCGPLKCAAARWAPRAAAVIVGAILNRVDGPGAGHQIVRGGGIGGREGWDGWLVQNVHLDT
ncbi:hypothetical protein DFH09DRAFT_1119353 [Mycena vulgaris]|nr:hypothetical protein DFH09DRAFT_1119353 [Mycena vulgaris]